jgi:hypothetical protein
MSCPPPGACGCHPPPEMMYRPVSPCHRAHVSPRGYAALLPTGQLINRSTCVSLSVPPNLLFSYGACGELRVRIL